MKLLLMMSIVWMGLCCFSTPASAQPDGTPFVQLNILRIAPDDAAAFVPILMPSGWGSEPEVDILSYQGEWEEVRLHYHFKYNGSIAPNVCALSFFDETFTGFRKITKSKP